MLLFFLACKFIAQNRDADIGNLFKHENHPYPPSFSERRKLRQGKKSDPIGILAMQTEGEPPASLDVKVFDGAAVVHMLPVTNIKTFNDYAANIFIPHIMRLLQFCRRVDIVWDTYLPSTIKEATREKREKGVRRKVAGQTKV